MKQRHSLSKKALRASIAAMSAGATFATGCLTGSEFREAAAPLVEQGVDSIMDGLIDGLFAVIDPDTTESTDADE